MIYSAIIFVRRSGAYGIGHVGWAFTIDNHIFNAGSVENHSGGLVTPPDQMGFWTLETNDPIKPMRLRRYDEFKVLDVRSANPDYAQRVVAWVHKQAYEAIGRNCMDDTYDVLRAYGIDHLPVPSHIWEPNHWFNHIIGEHYHIEPDGIDRTADKKPPEHEPMLSDLASLTADILAKLPPTPPTWRLPGTREANHFKAAVKLVPWLPTKRKTLFGRSLRRLGILRE